MTFELENPGRRLVLGASVAGAGLVLSACGKKEPTGEDVTATEDMMREHGVLRRILVVYRETAANLRANAAAIDAAAILQAAQLFQRFGEEYHERKLEEQYVFPAVQKAGGEAAGLIGPLLIQHQRGREITAYIESVCNGGKVGTADAEPLAGALESMARMYEVHTAFEDTIVFPAWKKTMSASQLDELSDKFEDIEKAQFHGDGFDMAVDQMKQIEQRLGLFDLMHYTAPPPPAAVNVRTTTVVKGGATE